MAFLLVLLACTGANDGHRVDMDPGHHLMTCGPDTVDVQEAWTVGDRTFVRLQGTGTRPHPGTNPWVTLVECD